VSSYVDAVGGVPDFVLRPPTGPYRRLNPTTKLVIALSEALVAFGVRGWVGPLVILAVVAVSGQRARVGRALLPFALATVPLVVSILLVNTFLYPGAADHIVVLGPLAPTWTGLAFALQATLRVVAFAMSAALLGLTTSPDELTADLERRGIGRRALFVLSATVRSVPRLVARAREITEAQRARALDTEGHIGRRIRGVLPLVGPLIFGALTDVEEQTMALEARGFSASARRAVIRVFPDSRSEHWLRWAVLVVTVLLLAASIAGWLAFLP
jgi:energy-coupling factor transport system permease protein